MNHVIEMDTAGAGLSGIQAYQAYQDTNQQTSSPTTAPLFPLSSTPLYSVEYPGYVQPTSISLAVERLGGQKNLEAAFGRVPQREGKESFPLELKLRPEDPYSHPITGEVVSTSNLVLRVVKRKRKQKAGMPQDTEHVGEYIAEIAGTIPKTGRFRCMFLYSLMCKNTIQIPYQHWPTSNTDMICQTQYRNFELPWQIWTVNWLFLLLLHGF